jgi:hypothetical protein
MKAGTPRKRSTFPVRPQPAVGADRVFDRIRALTSELEALHADLHGQAEQPGGGSPSNTLALSQFKSALDRLREMLWSYLDQAGAVQARAGVPCRHPELQNRADLLHLSYPHPNSPLPASSAEPGSFFDRLNVVIDAYMKRNEASPPAARKRDKIRMPCPDDTACTDQNDSPK